MKNTKKIISLIGVMALVVVMALSMTCFAEGEDAAAVNMFAGSFWSLVPPIIAIGLALITKEVYSSLFVGILVGAFFSTGGFHPVLAMDNLLNEGIVAAVSGTAGIFVFLVVLGVLVALVNKAGGSAAFGAWAEKNIKSRAGAMFATFI